MTKDDPTIEARLDAILSAMLDGDAIIRTGQDSWELELSKIFVGRELLDKFNTKKNIRGRHPRKLKDYRGRWILDMRGILWAIDRHPSKKIQNRTEFEVGLLPFQCFAFRNILALKMRVAQEEGIELSNHFCRLLAKASLDYVRMFYEPEIKLRKRSPYYDELDRSADKDDSLHRNQFRKSSSLRPRIRAQHKQ